MKKKLFSILLCIILISILLPEETKSEEYKFKNIQSIENIDYILDQKQLLNDNYRSIHSNTWIAQSFQPTKSPLVKVLIQMYKNVVINEPLELSIRESLTSNELVYTQIPGNQIPYYTNWIEFDIQDIEVNINQTYYIVIRSRTPAGQSYKWLDKTNDTGDPYNRGKQWISINGGFDWELAESEDTRIDCTFQTYSYVGNPVLNCIGFFNWTDIEPASTVSGTFIVQNIGTPLSNLNWEISNWPYWGVWEFNPKSGSNLKPEDGNQIVSFSFRAPNVTNSRYSGQIKIQNIDNESNYCTIETSLVTPKKTNHNMFDFIEFLRKFNQF
jgi:hypothetical protein